VYGDCGRVVRGENHLFDEIEIYQLRHRVVLRYSPYFTHRLATARNRTDRHIGVIFSASANKFLEVLVWLHFGSHSTQRSLVSTSLGPSLGWMYKNECVTI
jgi:hypothetical protein